MHNFLKKLAIMVDQGKILPSSINDIYVSHDDWCDFLSGDPQKECNCDPDIRIKEIIKERYSPCRRVQRDLPKTE